MITKFNKYNLIKEGVYFNDEEGVSEFIASKEMDMPKIEFGDKVKYVNNILSSPHFSHDFISNEQQTYIKQHIGEFQIVTGKFYGEEWWSRFGEGEGNDDPSWIPDKYLTKDVLPNYRPRTFIKEGLTDMMTPKPKDHFISMLVYDQKNTMYKHNFKDTPFEESFEVLLKSIDSDYGEIKFYDEQNDEIYYDLNQYLYELVKGDDHEEIHHGGNYFRVFKDKKIVFIEEEEMAYPDAVVFNKERLEELLEDDLNENRKEEKEKALKKDELRYLSKRERERLTDAQRKTLVFKRKERGSWNDADLKESLKDKMVGKSEDEVEDIIGDLKPTEMLHHACKYGLLDYVKKAIKDGADVHNTFYDEEPSEDYYKNFSAIDIAIENRQHGIVEYLLSLDGYKQIDFHILDSYIGELIENDNTKMMDFIIKNVGQDRHRMLVEAAIKSGRLDLLKYLIKKHNLDINHADGIYLREACNANQIDIIKYLLDKGIMKGVHAMLALKIAISNRKKTIYDILISAGIKPDKETLDMARSTSLKLYFKLLKNKLKR